MVEFAVATAVLALLLLGMPVIAGLHRLQLAAIEATRLAAFMDSWRPAGAASPAATQLHSQLFPAAETSDQAHLGAITLQVSRGAPPGKAALAGQLLLAPFRALRGVSGGFDLRNAGLHRAELAAGVVWPDAVPEPFADLDISFRESYQLLGDNWSSAGPAQVATRSGGLLVPPGAQALRPLITLGASILSLVEPAWRHFCPGLVNPEIVPGDRLRDYDRDSGRSRQPTAWRAPC
jgi:hypothetical protein